MEIDRSQLLTELRTPRCHVTLLESGRGYGKTYLLAMAARHEDAVLLDLTQVDFDPSSVARYAHQQLVEKFGEHPDSQLAYMVHRETLRPALAANALKHDLQLYHRLRFPDAAAPEPRLPGRLVAPPYLGPRIHLLIDNAEDLDSRGRRFFLDYLLADFPPQAHLVVAMSDETNLPIRGVIGLQIRVWTEQELAFDDDTVRSLLDSDDLRDRLIGWPYGVVHASQGQDPTQAARAVLAMLPEPLMPSLRRASLLPVWRPNDPIHVGLDLRDNWLADARAFGLPGTRVPEGFAPHPIILQVLHDELLARPGEYREANAAVARAGVGHRPLGAVQAFLNAGEIGSARAVLEQQLEHLRHSEALAELLPLLPSLGLRPGEPLHSAFAQALFDSGRLADGLREAERAVRGSDPEHRAAALQTLGAMRLRLGQPAEAAAHLVSALEHTTSVQMKAELYAAAALAASLAASDGAWDAARTAIEHANSAIELIEDHALESISEQTVMARTALTVAYAALGHRAVAAQHAQFAAAHATTNNVTGTAVLLCLTALCDYYSADGQLADAESMYARAREIAGLDILNPTAGSISGTEARAGLELAAARLHMRKGAARAAAHHALRAATTSNHAHLEALRRAALTLYALSGVLPVGNYTLAQLTTLRDAFAQDTQVTSSVATLASTFGITALPGLPRNTVNLNPTLPPEVRVVVALRQVHESPRAEWEYELIELTRRVGRQVILSYAELLGVPVPETVIAPVSVELTLLTAIPEIRVNGRDLCTSVVRTRTGRESLVRLTPRMIAMMLTLYQHRQVTTTEFTRHLGPQHAKQNATRMSELRLLIRAVVPDYNPSVYGGTDTRSWRWSSDLDRIEVCEFTELTGVYRSAVFSGADDTYPIVQELRQDARRRLIKRMVRWYALEPLSAMQSWSQLTAVDPALPATLPVEVHS